MFKYLLKNKTLFLILILAFWLVPTTISTPEQSSTESVVIGIGVDKNDADYEVSLQYVIPHTSSTSESMKITSVNASSLDNAIQKLNETLGKYCGFAHCRVLVFNEKASEDNITKLLDFLLRQKTNTNNIILLETNKTAKEVLNVSNNLDSDLYTFLNNNTFSNELKNYYKLSSIGDYFKSYFSPVKCIGINIVDVEEKKDKQSGQSGGEGGGSSGGGSSQSGGGGSQGSSGVQSQESGEVSKKQILNDGKILVVKNDKKLLTLDAKQSENLSWFDKESRKSYLEIKDFSDEFLQNANLRFNIFDKDVKMNVYFENCVPTAEVNVKINIRTSEIVSSNLNQNDYEMQQHVYSQKLFDKIKEQIITDMKEAESHFKSNKYDIVGITDRFYKFKNKDYKNYLKTKLGDRYFLQDVIFKYNVDISKGI